MRGPTPTSVYIVTMLTGPTTLNRIESMDEHSRRVEREPGIIQLQAPHFRIPDYLHVPCRIARGTCGAARLDVWVVGWQSTGQSCQAI